MRVIDRFWAKVRKGDGCWEWTAHRNRKGYGTLNIEGTPELAHRVSYIINTGPIPSGLCVLHRCDNPACVRPEHLFLGTLADNNADMHAKGRASGGSFPGETAPLAKLTDAAVREIRSNYRIGDGKIVACLYGISPSAAWLVLARKTWKHVQ